MKLKASLKHLPVVMVVIVSLAFIGFAMAEETTVDANANVEVQTDASGKPVKPLDLIRKAKEVQRNIQQNAFQAKQELRMETKTQFQGAGASGERKDIAKDRMASSTSLKMKLKAGVRLHAGLVKERFALAIRQLNKFIERIESRLEKLEAEGVATASVDAKVEVAKTAVVTAQADAQAVATYIEGVSDSNDRETVKTELRALVQKAQASLKAAHAAVKEAVRALVSLNASAKTEASVSTE